MIDKSSGTPISIKEWNIEKLSAYLSTFNNKWDSPIIIEQFKGGHSNQTYLLRIGEEELVLRHPPYGVHIKSGHDMHREYRIMNSLYSQFPKVPKTELYCDDLDIIGVPFYLMQRLNGIIIRRTLPEGLMNDDKIIHKLIDAFTDTFVALHEVDYKSVGLENLGNPNGFLERQVQGWAKRYEACKIDGIPDMEKLLQWLSENIPTEVPNATLIHNDYKFDNIMLDAEDCSKVIAVLDWEMSTIGNPLMDLGVTLSMWDRTSGFLPNEIANKCTRTQLAELYFKKSKLPEYDLIFYYALGLLKLAVVVQQLYFRYKQGLSTDKRFLSFNDLAKQLAISALDAIDKKKMD